VIALAAPFGAKFAKLVNPPSFGTLASRNGLQARNSDFRRLCEMISLHCAEIWWDSVQWRRRSLRGEN